jgi:hypothetical protein
MSQLSRRTLLNGVTASGLAANAAFGFCAEGASMTTQGPFRTLEELRASLASAGISAIDQRTLLGLARPTIALQSKAADDKDIAIGASKIGGATDVPRGFEWPTRAPTTQGDGELKAHQGIIA